MSPTLVETKAMKSLTLELHKTAAECGWSEETQKNIALEFISIQSEDNPTLVREFANFLKQKSLEESPGPTYHGEVAIAHGAAGIYNGTEDDDDFDDDEDDDDEDEEDDDDFDEDEDDCEDDDEEDDFDDEEDWDDDEDWDEDDEDDDDCDDDEEDEEDAKPT